MKKTSLFLAALVACAAINAPAQDRSDDKSKSWNLEGIKHVLLISVDGMHAVDFANCAKGIPGVNNGAPYCPHLAALASTGVHYTAASTSKPSDSFPGLMTIVSGATPRTLGVYYDVAYDRSLDAPTKTTGNGVAGRPLHRRRGSDRHDDRIRRRHRPRPDQGERRSSWRGLTDRRHRGSRSIRRAFPAIRARAASRCIRGNLFASTPSSASFTRPAVLLPGLTSIRRIHRWPAAAAWAFSMTSTRRKSTPLLLPLPGVKTPTGITCATVPDPGSDTSAWTNSFQNIQCYDQLKVNAILN